MSAWLLANRSWLEPLLWGLVVVTWAPLAWWRLQTFCRDVRTYWKSTP